MREQRFNKTWEWLFNISGCDIWILQYHRVNIIIMATDTLAPCVVRSSATMIFDYKRTTLAFQRKDFNKLHQVRIEKKTTFLNSSFYTLNSLKYQWLQQKYITLSLIKKTVVTDENFTGIVHWNIYHNFSTSVGVAACFDQASCEN